MAGLFQHQGKREVLCFLNKMHFIIIRLDGTFRTFALTLRVSI